MTGEEATSKAPHEIYLQLRALRLAAGLSLTKAAAQAGMSDVTLGSWERGDRNPPLETLDATFRTLYGHRLAVVPADVTDEQLERALRLLATFDMREAA